MSYCRWSSDGFRSDVYVYADVRGGFTIHVASARVAFHPAHPLPGVPVGGDAAAWETYTAASTVAHEFATREAIDHLLAGASLNEPTAAACLNRLLELRGEGFAVPEFAIDLLVDEVAEGDREQ